MGLRTPVRPVPDPLPHPRLSKYFDLFLRLLVTIDPWGLDPNK